MVINSKITEIKPQISVRERTIISDESTEIIWVEIYTPIYRLREESKYMSFLPHIRQIGFPVNSEEDMLEGLRVGLNIFFDVHYENDSLYDFLLNTIGWTEVDSYHIDEIETEYHFVFDKELEIRPVWQFTGKCINLFWEP